MFNSDGMELALIVVSLLVAIASVTGHEENINNAIYRARTIIKNKISITPRNISKNVRNLLLGTIVFIGFSYLPLVLIFVAIVVGIVLSYVQWGIYEDIIAGLTAVLSLYAFLYALEPIVKLGIKGILATGWILLSTILLIMWILSQPPGRFSGSLGFIVATVAAILFFAS